jgi:hypothetical protein
MYLSTYASKGLRAKIGGEGRKDDEEAEEGEGEEEKTGYPFHFGSLQEGIAGAFQIPVPQIHWQES